MEFNEFSEKIATEVKKLFDANCKVDATVEVNEILSPNDTAYQGMSIMANGLSMSLIINFNQYYSQYLEGVSIDEIILSVLEQFKSAFEDSKSEMIRQFESVLNGNGEDIYNNVLIRLIDSTRNVRYLNNLIYKPVGPELAVTVNIVNEDIEQKGITYLIPIAKKLLENKNLDIAVLLRSALQNTEKKLPPRLEGIEDSMLCKAYSSKMCPTSSDFSLAESKESMYVLTNSIKQFGASVLFYEDMLNTLAFILNDDYYILPSSIHEVLIVPKCKAPNKNQLIETVRAVKRIIDKSADVLNDNVLLYDSKLQMLLKVKA